MFPWKPARRAGRMGAMAKVLIAEDHPLFREAVRDVIGRVFLDRGQSVACLEVGTRRQLAEITEREEDIDLILLDLVLPDGEGLKDLAMLRSRLPATPVMVISMVSDPATMHRVMACGAAGFVPKSLPKQALERALQIILDGGIYVPREMLDSAVEDEAEEAALTPRQLAVLTLLAEGRSNKEIARELAISSLTVKAHVTAVLRKLGVGSRAQAIVAFRKLQGPRSGVG